MVTLVREIERRLEPRDQIEELRIDLCDAACQRAFELIECDTSLKRRRRLDQIGDRLRLHEIALAVEKRAQRELAGIGQTGAGGNRRCSQSPAAPPGCRAR